MEGEDGDHMIVPCISVPVPFFFLRLSAISLPHAPQESASVGLRVERSSHAILVTYSVLFSVCFPRLKHQSTYSFLNGFVVKERRLVSTRKCSQIIAWMRDETGFDVLEGELLFTNVLGDVF